MLVVSLIAKSIVRLGPKKGWKLLIDIIMTNCFCSVDGVCEIGELLPFYADFARKSFRFVRDF